MPMTDFVTRLDLHGATSEDHAARDVIVKRADFSAGVRSA